ncbi:MAG: flagellar hook-length control protein FliK [Ruminiclostridium sp.]|nr:flagellar hook-length control protein FliK [Ruminiclostridium sp.]
MDMTISAVQLGTSSQPQAKTSETGFSDVLTEVRTASPQVTDSSQGQPSEASAPAEMTVQQPEVQPEAPAATAELTVESFSAEFSETVIQLIAEITGGNPEENDRVIDALLEILKKMSGNSDEEEPELNLVMELLASMLGDNGNKNSLEFTAAFTETTVTTAVTEVNTEIRAILSAEAETQPVQLPTQNVTETADAFTAPVQQETTSVQQEELPVSSGTELPAQQTAEGYEKLLNDILNAARKDLGLEKAELKTVLPEETAVNQLPVQTENGNKGFVLPFNHKDGTNELNSILGGTSEETADSEQEIKVTVPQDNSAALMENLPKQTEAVKIEKPAEVNAPLPEQQIADEILSKPETLLGGRTEFTMELNPESLGKITVKLVSTEGRVEVNITAENDTTRALLENRAENIGAALRNNGVELERYQVVSGHEDAQLMQESYDGSSKNPYGRNDEEQQTDENGDDFLEILQQL